MKATTRFEGCITLGPWGGPSGNEWVYKHEGLISKIILKYRENYVVDSIKFQTISEGAIHSSRFGKPSVNSTTQRILVDCPNEYIVAISGTYGMLDPFVEVIKSISFTTNKNHYGPFGSSTGTAFSLDVKGEMIIGFHGRARDYIDAIGVYVMPKAKALASVPNPTYISKIMNEPCSSLPIMAMPREAGPWGAGGGKPWDDGVFSSIKQVHVHLGELNVIYALQFEYLKKDGKSVLSQIHGGTNGSKLELVDLDGEEEFLTGVSGFYGPVEGHNGLEAIASITFHTNKRILGPFGEEKGVGYRCFSSAASPGKVVGFQGRNNGFLSSIGVHMEYF